MRRIQACAVLALALAAAIAACTQDDPLQGQVLAKERQELNCLKTGDYAEFAELLAEDAVFVDSQGPASKSVVVKNTREFRLQDYTIENPRFVRLSEASGILAYKISETGVSHGRPFSTKAYISAVWAKRDGKWACLFSQETGAN